LIKKKLVYIVSDIDKALAFEWIADSKELRTNFDVHFILLNAQESTLYRYLVEKNYPVTWIPYEGKKQLMRVIFNLYRYFKRERTAIVHTHLFDASVAGLIAARLAGVPKRIYTRHHSTYHHVYFPRAVYYDRLLNSLATRIVAISKVVEQVLVEKEEVSAKKVVLLHHGFDLALFSEVQAEQIKAVIVRNNIPAEAGPKIGVVSRYTYLKGIQYIVRGFSSVLKEYPNAHLILANARGDYASEIKVLLAQLPPHSYTEILFEHDIPALYKLFDVYVHTPVDEHSEAFGQTYVEALAAGVPSVFTLSGVAGEFIKDKKNALVVPYKDEKAIAGGIKMLLQKASLRRKLVENGQLSVTPGFALERMIKDLITLYKH
jgi:glycosyltransferase involved in cell wall biosynthesis